MSRVHQHARFINVEKIIHVYATHREADDAERAALAALSPQERLDRALILNARYREALGDAGQGLARVARTVPFERR